ncbi:MAG: glycoside hydrolase family 32 protein [Bacteroidales bacterium]|jgi:fructan beta-fructosidase
MKRYLYFYIYFMFCTIRIISAQNIIKRIPDDQFGLSYAEVFENMHYNQMYRPQVHYTPITGQIADATGLIYYKGMYHLFYMYDEWSRSRRYNKNWGYATSYDCIYWEQKPQILNSLLDNRPGSGCGIVDWNNTLGLQSGIEKTLVVFYTDYGRGSCLAFSRDAGKTWIRHKSNPVIPMPSGRSDRDPLVFWYKPDQSWRLVQFEEPGFAFYKSQNLIKWDFLSRIEGFYECPDFFELPLDGDCTNKRWIILDANCEYRIGEFNGTEFISTMQNMKIDYGDLYATQTYKHSYEGDGPLIQLAFLKLNGKPDHDRVWSQQQCFPCELKLRTINGDMKLCRYPIDGIKQLRYDSHIWNDIIIRADDNPLADIHGDVFEIIVEMDFSKSSGFEFIIRGERILFNAQNNLLKIQGKEINLNTMSQKMKIRVIIDRNSLELFVNEGEISYSSLFYPNENDMGLKFSSLGGNLTNVNLELYKLSSIWLKREQELGFFRSTKE